MARQGGNDMLIKHVPGAVCPQCAGQVAERYTDDGTRVLGRSCLDSSCRWRQFSQVSQLSLVSLLGGPSCVPA